MRPAVVALLAGCTLAIGCSDTLPPSNQTAKPAASTLPASTPSQPAAGSSTVPVPARDSADVPADFRDLWKQAARGGQLGQHGAYTYQYAARGERAVAVLIPRPIPRDDTILVATISDLAQRVFRVDLSGATPRLTPTEHGNAIMFGVPGPYTYFVLTIKNETREGAYGPGEPHTLLLWRWRI